MRLLIEGSPQRHGGHGEKDSPGPRALLSEGVRDELALAGQIELGDQRYVIAPAQPIVRIAHLECGEACSLCGWDEEIIDHEAAVCEMALMIVCAPQRILAGGIAHDMGGVDQPGIGQQIDYGRAG